MGSSLNINNQGISIVATADHLANAANIFNSYMQQSAAKKELIIVISNDLDNFEQWNSLSKAYPMVRVYQQDAGTTAGECLNYGIERAIFEYVALFHEEHHYGREYLKHSMEKLKGFSADLAGKRTYHIIYEDIKQQTLISPGYENRYTDFVILSTFIFRRALFKAVKFNSSNTDLDLQFCADCRNKGFSIFSTDCKNYLYCRKTI